ncbi:MAG: hypothetical protein QM756_42675 [Polyangiaceae bacterium]
MDAYLVFRLDDDAWRIVDEGDVQTTRKMRAHADTLRANWKDRVWECPHCKDVPDFEDEPPEAFPPLGPSSVKGSTPIPPGAPETVEYGRSLFPRFASAVDVPLFLKATPQSTNGDGRWFYFLPPEAGTPPFPPGEATKYMFGCAIGGHFWNAIPPNARPDPAHVGEPKVKYTELFEKRQGELVYERYLYSADGVMNYVLCSFDPTYEAYFYAIVKRMGQSMRAVAGGQVDRVERESQPYQIE